MSGRSEILPDRTNAEEFSLIQDMTSSPSVEGNKTEQDDEESKFTLISIVVFMVGFSEGLTHLATLAIYYLFKDDLGTGDVLNETSNDLRPKNKFHYYKIFRLLRLSPAQVSLLFVAPAFPWFLKPLFGDHLFLNNVLFHGVIFMNYYAAFYSDSCPVLGMRRKPYLLFFAFFQAVGFVLLAYGVHGVIGAVLSLFVIAFSASFCSAIAEALLVEISEGQREGASNSVSDFTIAKGVGSLLVAYFSGYLLETVSKRTVFLITGIFPLMIFFTCLPVKESGKLPSRNAAEQLVQLGVFLRQKLIWGIILINGTWFLCLSISFLLSQYFFFIWSGPVIFILAFMSGPDYDDALFFYYTDVLDFKPSFMGTLRFTYGIAAIAGTIFYRKSLYATSYKKILWTSILFSLPIYLSPILLVTGINLKLGISDQLFVLSGGFLNEAIAEIQLLPLLVLTACICPAGLEGSAYSSMLAVRNLGSALSKTSSAILMLILGIDGTHFNHLVGYIFICGCFNLLPFFFLSGIPSDEELEKVTAKRANSMMRGETREIAPPYVPIYPGGSLSFDHTS